MQEFILKNITEKMNFEKELASIGFDFTYSKFFKDKLTHKNIKIFNLSTAQANILKQTALIFGADCAVNREVITGKSEKSNAILCGNISQLKKIAAKLKNQPFKLKILGEEILNFLDTHPHKTKLVGILNITTNSCSDGGLYFEPKKAEKHLIELINDGADMIDIGAESTKPFAKPVTSDEQIKRLKPILKFINKENITLPISIDTRSAKVAEFVLDNGATVINDVSGFDYDEKMADIIAKYQATIVIQHSKGTPETMQINPIYENIIEEIYLALLKKIELAKEKGIKNIIIDPGIGFGKIQSDNLDIINNIETFFGLKLPLMLGISRKSFLGINNDDNSQKDTLTLAFSYPLMLKGVDYLRVHNIKLHKALLQLIEKSIPN